MHRAPAGERPDGAARARLLAVLAAATLATLLLTSCDASGGAEVSPRTLEPDAPRRSKVPFGYVRPQAGLAPESAEKIEATLPVSTTTTETPASVATSGGIAPARPRFPVASAMAHVRYLAGTIGVRQAGSPEERKAADYVVARLTQLGYETRVEDVPLPNGTTSRNVIAEMPGTSARRIVIGAHLDSKPPSPGGNDNASGVGAVLAIAEALSGQDIVATVEFVFFGAEEIVGSDVTAHHFGSRQRVKNMTPAQEDQVAGMISLDMIAVGDRLHVRTMGRGPQSLAQDLLRYARTRVDASYLRDPAKTGQSDHEPYELAGMPAAWVESLPDPKYHTKGDTSAHVSSTRLAQVGQFVLDYVASRTEAGLAALRK